MFCLGNRVFRLVQIQHSIRQESVYPASLHVLPVSTQRIAHHVNLRFT
jgi:hypothetical protein